MRRFRYAVFDTGKARRDARGRWRVEGPGLKPPLVFDERSEAQAVRQALEQAFQAGRAMTRDTLEPIGKPTSATARDTDPNIGDMHTITLVRGR
jgi:hypothetical protein